MIYRYIAPSPILQEFVRDYLVAHFIFDDNQDIPSKPYSPKSEQTITFIPKGKLTINNSQHERTTRSSASWLKNIQL